MRIYNYRKANYIAEHYFEVPYKEYYSDGTLKQIGTEDFSSERWNKQTEIRHIYTWDGERRNKGGYRWFWYEGAIFVSKGDLKELKAWVNLEYPKAKKIELRLK